MMSFLNIIIVLLAVLLGPSLALSATWLNQKYLMAFHACTSCTDPVNHYTYVGQSDDGVSWTILPNYTTYQGSVPDLIHRNNTIYVYNPGYVRRYDISTTAWADPAKVAVTIRHTDGSAENFVDPCPYLNSDGKIILFYLVVDVSGDPAKCQTGQSTCTKTFRSATEVTGSDGTQFTVDAGNRAEIQISGSTTSLQVASDPHVFQGPSGYILYIAKNGGVQAMSSDQLQGSYTNISGLPDGMLVSNTGSVPSGYYNPDTGQYVTYVHSPDGSTTVIKRAVHSSLNTPLTGSAFTTILTGSSVPGLGSAYSVASPGFHRNLSGATTCTIASLTDSATAQQVAPWLKSLTLTLSEGSHLGGMGTFSLMDIPYDGKTYVMSNGAEAYYQNRFSNSAYSDKSQLECVETTRAAWAKTLGVSYGRHPVTLPWGMIETANGTYRFEATDVLVKAAQAQGVRMVGLIAPFTDWDQRACGYGPTTACTNLFNGGRSVRVRGHAKVMTHLMFGILALAADQLIRLV
ncbi:MAG: hypothetical protein HQK58_14365, partial [Deltaproteobacteria bacterium]|nr:hypothetical protein [Deltaproteobacteria bacterium]